MTTLALTKLERKRCEKALTDFMSRRRPPPHIRDQIDVGYRIEGQSIEIFEIRPDCRKGQMVLKGCEGMSYANQFYALAGQIRPV